MPRALSPSDDDRARGPRIRANDRLIEPLYASLGGGAKHSVSSDVPPPITTPPPVGLPRRALQLVYDVAIALAWSTLLPMFLIAGVFRRRYARKALALSTVGLPALGPSAPGRPRVLVHGVSVGEIKASQSLVAALRERYDVVISAISDTGVQVARQLYPGMPVVRYPFDFFPLVRRFWRRVRPDFVLLMELEAWPCFLREANRRGAPVAVVSGRITAESFRRYELFGALPEFERISLFAAQDEAYADRFRVLCGAPERVVVTGNVKVDGLRVRASSLQDEGYDRLVREAGLAPFAATGDEGDPSASRPLVVLAGSTHEPEEQMFLRAALAATPSARLIIVPRHPERAATIEAELAGLLSAERRPERLSVLRADGRNGRIDRPLIADTIGELERLYGLADIVFVGGSLVPHGGQNMMEPAAQGRAVVYGPHVQNFLEETALLESACAARRVADEAELSEALRALAGDAATRARMGESARGVVATQRGATRSTLVALRERCGLA